MKNKGFIPSIIFGSIILVCILTLALFVFWGEDIIEIFKEGFTDDESVSVESN
ncbi:hypothetical protein [Metabacillus litoralis]|uniref:hypothetical protein n=1 Tax=Metabacillus litoralis TaxID=152268 RepID=UPI0013CE6AC6|nr:hypothetical protein [Metabacillus litoralis]